MSALPTDDGTLDRRVALGEMCSECSSEFVKPHGFPVVCPWCYALLSFHDRTQIHKSTHKEANRAGWEAEGKKQKQARLAKRVEND